MLQAWRFNPHKDEYEFYYTDFNGNPYGVSRSPGYIEPLRSLGEVERARQSVKRQAKWDAGWGAREEKRKKREKKKATTKRQREAWDRILKAAKKREREEREKRAELRSLKAHLRNVRRAKMWVAIRELQACRAAVPITSSLASAFHDWNGYKGVDLQSWPDPAHIRLVDAIRESRGEWWS